MHNDHIGDSLDAAKAVTIGWLRDAEINVGIIPLPSHEGFDVRAYTQCVASSDTTIVFESEQPRYSAHHRRPYLDEALAWIRGAPTAFDAIIFDPDTGIRPDRDTNKFFGVRRIQHFMDELPAVAIGAYQHKNTGGLTYTKSLNLLRSRYRCGYDFGNAAVLFWGSRSACGIVTQIQRTLASKLNPRRVLR